MIIKHPRLIIKQHGIIKNYRYIGDVSWTPLSEAPNGLQISPPDEEQEAAAPYRETR